MPPPAPTPVPPTLPLALPPDLRLTALHSGLFISRGHGLHPTRTIDSWELILVRTGRLDLREEATHFELHPGHALILRPHHEHGGTRDYPRDLSFYWLHFHLHLVPPPTPSGLPPPSATALPFLPQLTRLTAPERLTQLIRLYLDQQEAHRPAHLQDILMLLILHELAAADPAPIDSQARAALRLAARVHQHIRAHFAAPIATADIARAFDCNPDHLGRSFRAATGRTITDEIHRQRLTAAQRHLIDADWNIARIARAVGYPDAGYFTRLFRRHTGLTPNAFRRLHARAYVNPE